MRIPLKFIKTFVCIRREHMLYWSVEKEDSQHGIRKNFEKEIKKGEIGYEI